MYYAFKVYMFQLSDLHQELYIIHIQLTYLLKAQMVLHLYIDYVDGNQNNKEYNSY
jgi:hypothetical protein